MRVLLLALLTLTLVPQCGKAQQPSTVTQQPDCIRAVFLTTVSSSANFDNRQAGCDTWAFYYSTQATLGVSVQVESATTGLTGTPNAFTLFTGATLTGANPSTAISAGSWTGSAYVPWIRVSSTVVTAFGGPPEIRGVLYGWRMGRGGSGGGGGGVPPSQNPNLTRYQFNRESVLGGTTDTLTVQSCSTCNTAYFESGDAYCTAAFTVQFSQNGTAATTTAGTVIGVNGASTTNTPLAFFASNVGAGTTLRRYYGVAGQTILFDLSDFFLGLNAGTGRNLSMAIISTPGATCRGQMQWRRELQ
jgi:hypothetical protein